MFLYLSLTIPTTAVITKESIHYLLKTLIVEGIVLFAVARSKLQLSEKWCEMWPSKESFTRKTLLINQELMGTTRKS